MHKSCTSPVEKFDPACDVCVSVRVTVSVRFSFGKPCYEALHPSWLCSFGWRIRVRVGIRLGVRPRQQWLRGHQPVPLGCPDEPKQARVRVRTRARVRIRARVRDMVRVRVRWVRFRVRPLSGLPTRGRHWTPRMDPG